MVLVLTKSVLIFFVLLITNFVFGNDDDVQYEFEIEKVDSVKYGIVDEKYITKELPTSHLSDLKYEDRKKLCIAVQKFTSLQLLPNYEYYLFEAIASQIEYNIHKIEVHITGYCPTIPETYWRAGNAKDAIIIIFEKSVAHLYKFEVEHIKSISVVSEDECNRKMLKNHLFSVMSPQERWQFCVAAQRKFKNLNVDPNRYIGELKVFKIEFPKETLQDVVISCPTNPISTYLRFARAENKIKIMLVYVNDEVDV